MRTPDATLEGHLAAALMALVSVASLSAAPASAQAIIRVGESVSVRFGVLLQTQAEFAERPNASGTGTTGYAEALFIRRARLIMGGQVASNIFFFFQTDNPDLGRKTSAANSLGSGPQLINGEVEWRIDKAFNVIGGLFRVPYSRESMKAVASLFEIDAQTFNSVQGSSMGWTVTNRDTGFQVRGYVLSDHLEYRVAATQGARQPDSRNSFALTARIQYNFFGTEVYNTPSYPGSYIDGKKMLTIGAAYQEQGTFKYASADVFASIPVGPGIVEGTFQYQYLDGATMFPLLAHQNIAMIEAGYYATGPKVGPWARYEQVNYNGATSRNEERVWAGIGWFPFRHNFNVKGAYERIMPKASVDRNQFVLQLQLYYF